MSDPEKLAQSAAFMENAAQAIFGAGQIEIGSHEEFSLGEGRITALHTGKMVCFIVEPPAGMVFASGKTIRVDCVSVSGLPNKKKRPVEMSLHLHKADDPQGNLIFVGTMSSGERAMRVLKCAYTLTPRARKAENKARREAEQAERQKLYSDGVFGKLPVETTRSNSTRRPYFVA